MTQSTRLADIQLALDNSSRPETRSIVLSSGPALVASRTRSTRLADTRRVLVSTSSMPSHTSIPVGPPMLTSNQYAVDENIRDNTRLVNIELALKRSRSLQAPAPANQASFNKKGLSFTTPRQKIKGSTRLADIESALEESNSVHAPASGSTFSSSDGSSSIGPQRSLSSVPVRVANPTHTKAFNAAMAGRSICIHG
jgi:hypothetical protein